MVQSSLPHSGVIWITGLSAAGKTTVGRKVESELKRRGAHTIFLDGDDLRSIFAGRWGYERKERVELARVYFRLCSHLAAQGCTVVISAVAMYQEVRDWLRQNIPFSTEVFLDVPDEERRRRDRGTKRIFDSAGNFGEMYDEPDDKVIRLENFGQRSPEEVANRIVHHYLNSASVDADFGRHTHWDTFYGASTSIPKETPFARWVNNHLPSPATLLEVGCGNGRDAFFFSTNGREVTAIDPSRTAIERCRRNDPNGNLRFLQGTLPQLAQQISKPDAIYSRFVIHAMPLDEEEEFLDSAASLLDNGGRLFIECRSINDSMAREGEVISPRERILGHYRRFIDKDELQKRLEARGFVVWEAIESKGLAVYGDEDPTVIRVAASKGRCD